MKRHLKVASLLIALSLLLSSKCQNTGEDEREHRFGYVNFNLGESPVSSPGRQELSLYGCNTEITTRGTIWNGQENLEWNTKNQVLENVPFGYREEDGRKYFISKYYMASPPVMELMTANAGEKAARANIGLVIPDQFTFFGEKPVQIVHLDYTILEPVYLNYVEVDYYFRPGKNEMSCGDLGVDLIPLNIRCKDFLWRNKPSTGSIQEAKGASGIGRLKNEKGQNQVFLPSYGPNGEDCLDCTITILDDILLNHEVFFATEDGFSKTISLTDFYKKNGHEMPIPLACRPRFELPAGCKPND
ncbi:hypothetical protein [Roseivirga sp. UBA838]|uniref:hypothetical protein n=1 Tax=Roseivirga sp. UBA838 TaxID=1947393 RepID=UPI00257E10EE|nr:hypothetical protein [Roseivirga sp. UBA838]|tara:strand:+ start:36114 stop:37019 length:906 start_codon:yes stop_codon:yes gene_type:complete